MTQYYLTQWDFIPIQHSGSYGRPRETPAVQIEHYIEVGFQENAGDRVRFWGHRIEQAVVYSKIQTYVLCFERTSDRHFPIFACNALILIAEKNMKDSGSLART